MGNQPSEGDVLIIPSDTPTPKEEAPKSKVFTEDEVESIRKQEKDKLYKRIEEADFRTKAMEEQMNTIAQEREAARKEAEDRAKQETELLRQREIDEMSAKELLLKREDEFNAKIQDLESDYRKRFEEIEMQRQTQEALLDKERRLQELNTYRQGRIHAESENIIPELLDLVSGNSEEEIETSISVLRDRSSAILESIQQAAQQSQGRLRGAPVTAPPIGPMETQTEYQTVTADDIRNMTMDQYEKMRDRLLNARSSRGRF